MSPLLDKLPAELRNDIYSLVLISGDPIDVEDMKSIHARTALLRTCRQVREEASGLFYGDNTFRTLWTIDEEITGLSWLFRLGHARASQITRMIIAPNISNGRFEENRSGTAFVREVIAAGVLPWSLREPREGRRTLVKTLIDREMNRSMACKARGLPY